MKGLRAGRQGATSSETSDVHGLASSQEAKKPKPWLDEAKPSQTVGLTDT
jgi:hypothetical protein